MTRPAGQWAGRSRRERTAESAPDRPRDLAGEVARLGKDGRAGAEGLVVGKLTILRQLRRLAGELER
jgi:hypothetical protein